MSPTIPAYDDDGANEVLEAKSSYGCFDDPGSVQIAREALADTKGENNGPEA